MSSSASNRTLWAALVLGVLGGLSAYPPNGWLAAELEKLSDQRLSLVSLDGSLWQGSGQLVLFDGNQQRAIPGRLQWSIHPTAWVREQQALIVLAHPSLNSPLQIQRTGGNFTLSAGQARFPANWLTAIGTPWNTLKPGGLIELAWGPVQAGQAARLTMRWQDAHSALSVVKPLGNYEIQADISPQGAMTARLNTLSGDLQLEGQATWTAAQGFGFSGYATASPAQQLALTGLLSQMGRLENNRYRLGS